ncbi:MAG: hypothetical protein IRY99_25840, partial [Isosphaeraceae bacterium]|nr:hypothetical protein [Isosphaeraceae bacterium]
LLALAPAGAAAAEEAWRYVVPPPGDPFEHPPLRALALSSEKPEDVVEKVAYRGQKRRYAQLRYGSPNSVRVTVVLDESGPGAVDLYVDANRNRRIEDRDKVEPSADRRTWRLPLNLAIVKGETTSYEPRAVVFRRGATGLTFSFAAAGYLAGRVRLDGREHAARRVDGDGNGLLTDPQDRLWIDLDDDGRWDPATEQFLYTPILAVGGQRYAVRSDTLGHRLELAALKGTGAMRLALKRPAAAKVAEISALLVGCDGSAISLSGEGETIVPIGEYRLEMVSIVLDDPSGGPRWSFVFSDRGGRRGEPVWRPVGPGATLALDPIGPLELHTGLSPDATARPGDLVECRPQLYTGDGLLIVTAGRGTATASTEGPTAAIALETSDGHRLASARSGFA